MRNGLSILTILMLAVGSGSVTASVASSFEGLFAKGNQYFQAGNYELARDAYETIARQNFSNAAVFYNLGNCYMNLGDIGRAVLNFRKAERLDYQDRDIRTNLEIARRLVAESDDMAEIESLGTRLLRLAHSIGSFSLAVIVVAMWWIAGSLFVLGSGSRLRKNRRRLFRVAGAAMIVFTLSGSLLLILIRDFEITRHGVAIGNPVIARNGPGEHFTEVFEQRPGYEVIVRRSQEGWVEIVLKNGYTAWVPAGTVEYL